MPERFVARLTGLTPTAEPGKIVGFGIDGSFDHEFVLGDGRDGIFLAVPDIEFLAD